MYEVDLIIKNHNETETFAISQTKLPNVKWMSILLRYSDTRFSCIGRFRTFLENSIPSLNRYILCSNYAQVYPKIYIYNVCIINNLYNMLILCCIYSFPHHCMFRSLRTGSLVSALWKYIPKWKKILRRPRHFDYLSLQHTWAICWA